MIDPKSDKVTGYHLFLEPSGALAEELSSVIKRLAGEYSSPIFAPHVTVLGRMPLGPEADISAKAEKLAKESAPFTLTLGSLNIEDVHFRALYSIIREQEAAKALHARANEAFFMTDQMPYLAHLSLLYGNYEQGRKEKTKESLSYPAGASFIADRLHLYRMEGTASEWYKVREFPFGA